MRKVRDQRPEFNGAIAYNDQTGRQVSYQIQPSLK